MPSDNLSPAHLLAFAGLSLCACSATALAQTGSVKTQPATFASLQNATLETTDADANDAVFPSIAPIVELQLPIAARHTLHAPQGNLEDGPVAVHTQTFTSPGAPWVRLNLAGTQLPGEASAEGARLRITSLLDGQSQTLTSESLAQWGSTSAYFNGDSVVVEVLMWPHTDEAWRTATLSVPSMWYGEPATFTSRSICDTVDDRVASTDSRAGRTSGGCTGWLVNDANGSSFTAGHCGMTAASVLSFRVPLSTSTGAYQASSPNDQYPVDGVSVQGIGNGVGDDWRVFITFTNSNTGFTARQAQASSYILATTVPAVTAGSQIRITGYGTTSTPVSPTLNGAQKTHTGAYTSFSGTTLRYRADTTGGNSGSPIIHEPTGQAIGIHTHGGCGTTATSANNGTALTNANFTTARNTPLGTASSGIAFASLNSSQPMLVLGDEHNNLGRMNPSTGSFGRTHTVGARWQSITWDALRNRALAINEARQLHTLNPATGSVLISGTVSGTTLTLTGLAHDPTTDTIYAVANSNGQLFTIDRSSNIATPRSSASAFRFTALEFDLATRQLFAIDMNTASGARLVRINPATGAMTLIGALGIAGANVQGLAIDQDSGLLLAIDSTTDSTLMINRTTGAGAVRLTNSGGSFGARLGMTGMFDYCPVDLDFNNDGLFPDDTDLIDLLSALAGSDCPACDSIDINRDGLFPDDADLIAFLQTLAGGCG